MYTAPVFSVHFTPNQDISHFMLMQRVRMYIYMRDARVNVKFKKTQPTKKHTNLSLVHNSCINGSYFVC